jgi:hypothetical protein
MSSLTDCTLLQSDIDSICGQPAASCVKFNDDKTKVITFARKINAINYNYQLCDECVTRTVSIKDLGVFLF